MGPDQEEPADVIENPIGPGRPHLHRAAGKALRQMAASGNGNNKERQSQQGCNHGCGLKKVNNNLQHLWLA